MSSQVITGTKSADKIIVNDDDYSIDADEGNNRITVGDGSNSILSGKGNDQFQ